MARTIYEVQDNMNYNITFNAFATRYQADAYVRRLETADKHNGTYVPNLYKVVETEVMA